MWLHSLKVAQLLRSAACLHTNQSQSYLNHLVHMSSQSGGCNTGELRPSVFMIFVVIKHGIVRSALFFLYVNVIIVLSERDFEF